MNEHEENERQRRIALMMANRAAQALAELVQESVDSKDVREVLPTLGASTLRLLIRCMRQGAEGVSTDTGESVSESPCLMNGALELGDVWLQFGAKKMSLDDMRARNREILAKLAIGEVIESPPDGAIACVGGDA